MAGIYIHIPFCKQACGYCNFHFVASNQSHEKLVDCICKEIDFRKDYFAGEEIETIYFGGGTPSVLSSDLISKILDKVYKNFTVVDNPEITLEANPDDLSVQKLKDIKSIGVNRLSIGIQSFYHNDLKYLNRTHNTENAISSIKNSQDIGINNITIDLIYGIPTSKNNQWNQNLNKLLELNIPHFSAYCLTVEEKTPLNWRINKGRVEDINEEIAIEQFKTLLAFADDNNFKHYEISNFCKDDYYSKHNISYWQDKKYLGLGPSAHSFNGKSREWNISNNTKYIEGVISGKLYSTQEILSLSEAYNEYIMTSLRTMWGIDKCYVKETFGDKYLKFMSKLSHEFLNSKDIVEKENNLILTKKGKLIADKIASELMYI